MSNFAPLRSTGKCSIGISQLTIIGNPATSDQHYTSSRCCVEDLNESPSAKPLSLPTIHSSTIPMPPPSDRNPDEGTRPTSSAGTPQSCRNAPLVIVSERGRHSDESRRIVRAQAARASAAQSRVTRARNREGRDSTVRDGPQSPSISELGQPIESPQSEGAGSFAFEPVQRPLAQWLASMLNLTPFRLTGERSRTGNNESAHIRWRDWSVVERRGSPWFCTWFGRILWTE